MNSDFTTIVTLIAAGISIILSIIAIYFSGKARTWHNYFRMEEQPQNLEDIVDKMARKIKTLDKHETDIISKLATLEKVLATAVQHVGIVRFDSGSDDGGNLSFAAAFLNAHQDGVVLTSLHGRQHNRIYTKIVKQGLSEQTLSEEEREAIMQALTKQPQNIKWVKNIWHNTTQALQQRPLSVHQ